MFRKLFAAFVCSAVLFLTACENKDSVSYLSKNEVYFFYQTTCPHCHTAAQYIKEKHPGLKVQSFDIKMPGNMKLFQQAVRDYKISTAAGTPLIGMGDNYIMGWGENQADLFEKYVEKYAK